MAIENALIAKIGGGLLAVGGASGGIYANYDTLKTFFFDTNIRSYLVQKEVVVASASTTSADTLYKAADKSKLFSCKLSNEKEIDTSCELFELQEKDKGFVNLSGLNSNSPTKSATFAEAKYYKLTIDVSKFSKWDESKLPSVKIIDSATGKTEITALKLLLRTDKISANTATNVFMAKLEATLSAEISSSDFPSIKCAVGKSNFACSIYKITSGDTTINNVKFPKLEKLSTTFATSVGVKDHFFLFTVDKKTDLSALMAKDSDKKILLKNNDDTKATFIFNSFVFNATENDLTKSNAVMLKDLTPPSS